MGISVLLLYSMLIFTIILEIAELFPNACSSLLHVCKDSLKSSVTHSTGLQIAMQVLSSSIIISLCLYLKQFHIEISHHLCPEGSVQEGKEVKLQHRTIYILIYSQRKCLVYMDSPNIIFFVVLGLLKNNNKKRLEKLFSKIKGNSQLTFVKSFHLAALAHLKTF